MMLNEAYFLYTGYDGITWLGRMIVLCYTTWASMPRYAHNFKHLNMRAPCSMQVYDSNLDYFR